MLTGDSQTTAQAVAKELGIDEIIAAGGTAAVCDEVMLEAKTAATTAKSIKMLSSGDIDSDSDSSSSAD